MSAKNKKITFEEAKNRFKDRNDIELIEFVGWKKKSKFYDLIEKDYFWSVPRDVYCQKSSHPKRKWEKTKQTNFERYGVECSLSSEKIRKKIKMTNVKKYGTENPFQSLKIKEKIRQTNIKKYGVENPSQVDEIKQKKKETFLKKYGKETYTQTNEYRKIIKKISEERYGVNHYSQSEKIKEKKKKTLKQKYGVENPSQFIEFQEKKKRTCLRKYGKEFYSQTEAYKDKYKHISAKYLIKETNEPLVEYYKNVPNPKPALFTIQQNIAGTFIVSKQKIDKLCLGYKESKTGLEILCEQLFETKHYNKKPKHIKQYYKPDFKLSPQIFLNVDGLYWHSELQKDRYYHFNLRKEFEESGLRIFQFREDETHSKPDIVKSIVNNSLEKIKSRIYARKCNVEQVMQKEATKFLKDNHLMGSTNAKHIGLYFNENLVSILSYKQRKNVCKIERFCSLNNHSVVGGFSKLLKHLEQNCLNPNITEIHNWVDLRYGTGEHLENKSFVFIKNTLGWKWTDFKSTYNRLKCRAKMDKRELTQQEYADELGWIKIYDAGQRLFVKKL